jgi:hypothetical protein
MKRLPLVFVLVLSCSAAVATPAWAWYAPEPHTAYIDVTGAPGEWDEWAGPDHPLDVIVHEKDPIPCGWEVVVRTTWLDGESGARLAPLVFDYTAAFKRANGPWGFRLLSPARALLCWSPPYQTEPSADPRLWARDWCVRLGQLPRGGYSGWVKESVASVFPTWIDETGAVLDAPVWRDAHVITSKHTFCVM